MKQEPAPNTLRRGKVIDLSSDGWGVVKEESGQISFVPNTWVDDEIEFEVISTGKFQRGKVHSWIHKSPAHRESPCPHWGQAAPHCGACSWMNIKYSEQLSAKEFRLKNILSRFKLSPQTIFPIISGPEFGYRNRIKLSQQNGKVGFQIPMSHEIAEIKKCIVAEDWINEKIKEVFATHNTENEIWIQQREGSSFAQGNTLLNNEMKKCLETLLQGLKVNALELFCGEGNFSEVLIKYSKKLAAYESSSEAILKIQKRFPKIAAKALNLYDAKSLNKLSLHSDTELLLLDPPRSGYRDLKELVQNLPKLEKIIYISCDPMTFARDVSSLSEWKFKKLWLFDLFPQTPHVEVMGYWERNA